MKSAALIVFGSLISVTSWASVECIAHRGDSALHLENSRASIESALQAGAPAIEFDVHHTRDGIAILLHDDTLEKTGRSKPGQRCPLKKHVSKIKFSELKRKCELSNGEEILPLREALRLFNGQSSLAFMELKDRLPPRSQKIVAEEFRGRESQLRIISFKDTLLDSLKRPLSRPLLRKGARIFHIAFSSEQARIDFDGVLISKFTRRDLKRFEGQNLEVGIWTVNDPQSMRFFARQRGVNYIASDKIELCMKVLDEL